MAALVDEFSALHLAHLVNAVGELIAAIFDMYGGLRIRQIAAVDVSDS
jgi:hypothetical protein